MATLFVSIVALILITLATLFANRNAIFEQVTSANHYRYSRAFEAAQGGLEYALAWLGTNGNPNCTPDPATCPYTIAAGATGAAWTVDTASHPPYNQKNTVSIAAQTFGDYTATVTLWRNSASPQLVEIVSVATGDATATVRQIVNVNALMFTSLNSPPLVVNGCVTKVVGNATIDYGSSSTAISSSQDKGCIDYSGFKPSLAAGSVDAPTTSTPSAGFAGSAWDHVFSITKQQMLALANQQTGGPTAGPAIYYYDYATPATTPPNNWHTSLGSPTAPIILIFDNQSGTGACPNINGGGGVDIYGVVYCANGGDLNGWGNANIYGSVVVDNTITMITVGTITNVPNTGNPIKYSVQPIISRVSGSWRDF